MLVAGFVSLGVEIATGNAVRFANCGATTALTFATDFRLGVANFADSLTATLAVAFGVTLAVADVKELPGFVRRDETSALECSCLGVPARNDVARGASWTVALAETGEIDVQSNAPLTGIAREPTKTTRRI
jgi:hypothetical protein